MGISRRYNQGIQSNVFGLTLKGLESFSRSDRVWVGRQVYRFVFGLVGRFIGYVGSCSGWLVGLQVRVRVSTQVYRLCRVVFRLVGRSIGSCSGWQVGLQVVFGLIGRPIGCLYVDPSFQLYQVKKYICYFSI